MITGKDKENYRTLVEIVSKDCRKQNNWLAKKVDDLIECSIKAETENSVLKTKVELYEKLIAKMLESDPDKSNDVFMLNGEIYRLAGYNIQIEPGERKKLTAEFLCTSDITHLFKEES